MDDKELVADMRETVRYWEHIYPRGTWGSYQRAHEQAADRIEALTAKAGALAEALRFYACPKKCPWEKTRTGNRCIISHEGKCGYTARAALKAREATPPG